MVDTLGFKGSCFNFSLVFIPAMSCDKPTFKCIIGGISSRDLNLLAPGQERLTVAAKHLMVSWPRLLFTFRPVVDRIKNTALRHLQ